MAYDFGVSETLRKLPLNIGRNAARVIERPSLKRNLQKSVNMSLGVQPASAQTPVVFKQEKPFDYSSAMSIPSASMSTPTPINIPTSNVGGGGAVGNFQDVYDNAGNMLESGKAKTESAIKKEYESEISRLRDEERRVNQVYGEALNKANTYYPEFQKQVGEQQVATDQQIEGLTNQRRMESERAMGQTRQLLNDLNRRQAAYMSATGTYGSALPEAYGEQFGRKAFDSLSQIQGSRDTAINALQQKSIEAKQFFDQKLLEGKQKYDQLVFSLQQQLNAQLDQIGSAKNQAASAKRQASVDAWNQYVNNKFALDQELLTYQTQLAGYASEVSTDTGELNTENPLVGFQTPAINSSNNANILGGIQGQVNQSANTNAAQAPIYSKRKLNPEESNFYGMSGYGYELPSGWATPFPEQGR